MDEDDTCGGGGEYEVLMGMPLPLHFLMVSFAGGVNRQQQSEIEYLQGAAVCELSRSTRVFVREGARDLRLGFEELFSQ